MSIRTALALLALSAHASAQCLDWSPAFEQGGLGPNGFGHAATVYDDGSGPALYVGGSFPGPIGHSSPNLIRWNGQDWSSIGTPNNSVKALIVFDDGSGPKLFAGGQFAMIGGVSTGAVGRFDGTAWSAVGDVQGNVQDFAVHDDGSGAKLYAAGWFSANHDTFAGKVARWDGFTWTVVGQGDDLPVAAITSFDDGTGPALAIGGYFFQFDGQPFRALAQWKNGSWSTLGGNPDWNVYALETFDDGSGNALYIGGGFNAIGAVNVQRLAKWNGTSITAVPGSALASGQVFGLKAYDDGAGSALIVAGSFTSVDGNPAAQSIARWDGTSWQALDTGLSGFGLGGFTAWDDGGGLGLITVGFFTVAGSAAADGIAYWRGGAWSPIGRETGVRGSIYASTHFDSGSGEELILAGKFRAAGGVTCNNIARWDGAALRPLGLGLSGIPYPDPVVRAVCVFDSGAGPELYAGGQFSSAGGAACSNFARWNGSAWIPMFVGGTNGGISALCVHDDGSGPALYVAGAFTIMGSRNIAKWNGTAWSPLSTGCIAVSGSYETISTLASYDDGGGAQLYAGGLIFLAGDVNTFYLARWNGSAWSSVGSGIDAAYTYENGVKALHVANLGAGSKLYVGGGFDGAGGLPASNIAVWDGAWSALTSSGSAQPARVSGFATFDAGEGSGPALYVQSSFVADDGQPTNGLARFDASGYSSIAAGINTIAPYSGTYVSNIGVFDDGVEPGEDLYVGGTFQGADGTLCLGLGRLRGCGEVGTTFCYGDGSATACPCGNASTVGDRAGCLNSLGTGATLRAHGIPSVSNDTLVLDGGAMTNSSVLYFQGASIVDGVAFGDGIKCVGGPFVRLGSKENVAGMSGYPVGSDVSISIKGFVTGAVTRNYAARYRNPAAFCTSDTFNYTNAVSIVWRL